MRRPFFSFAALCLGAALVGTSMAEQVGDPALGTGLIPLSDEEYDALQERDPLCAVRFRNSSISAAFFRSPDTRAHKAPASVGPLATL